MSRLLDFYGGLLTERQREVAQYTYNQDLSLSEISQLTGISRQAVSENLKRADKALEEFEACLGLKERFIFLEEEMAAMASPAIWPICPWCSTTSSRPPRATGRSARWSS